MDLESINRWEDYSRAKDEMMVHTDTASSPWFVVESDIKKHARLNMIAHLLSSIPYAEVPAPDVDLPKRRRLGQDCRRRCGLQEAKINIIDTADCGCGEDLADVVQPATCEALAKPVRAADHPGSSGLPPYFGERRRQA